MRTTTSRVGVFEKYDSMKTLFETISVNLFSVGLSTATILSVITIYSVRNTEISYDLLYRVVNRLENGVEQLSLNHAENHNIQVIRFSIEVLISIDVVL